MSKEYNGVIVFAADEKDGPAFKELRKVSLGDVRFPFGFFLVDEAGKTVVIPATEEDRRNTLLKAFPDMRPEVAAAVCDFDSDGGCRGSCSGAGGFPQHFECLKVHDPSERFYGCACIDIS
jgi:hypothetical protein